MPDILIRGMEMPRSCMDCRLNYGERRPEHGLTIVCKYSNGVVLPEVVGVVGRLPTCGLLELPPHGDLIDRDALLSRGKNNPFVDSEIYHPCVQTNCREIVMDEPVIVPAERREGDG